MAPVFKKAISWLGLIDDERGDEADVSAEDGRAARAAEPTVAPDVAVAPTGFGGDNSQTVLLSQSLLIAPPDYNSVSPVADRFLAGLATLMDVRLMPIEDAPRCVDFFSGMGYALNGSVKRVAKGIFLLTPAGAAVDPAVVEAILAELR